MKSPSEVLSKKQGCFFDYDEAAKPKLPQRSNFAAKNLRLGESRVPNKLQALMPCYSLPSEAPIPQERQLLMFVTVIHRISNPDQFESAAKSATEVIPSHLKLHQYLTATDRKTATCLWEARSVADVKEFLEPVVGHVSQNEYLPLNAEAAFGLPAASSVPGLN